MEIRRQDDMLELSELDPFLAELLRQIPESTKPEGCEAAEERLFCRPAAVSEKQICKEWKQYVEPELRRLFETSTETVAQDLTPLNGGNSKPFANCTLRIPTKNSEAWLNALNQARLVIASKYGFTEGELCDHYRSPIGSRRDLGLFQVNFYGFLQEFILHEMRTKTPGED
ncbi:MAG: DUF2017 domain-containing protein [Verrucomicrobiota bacterium]|nr:DUF2017 domain-containing protein [Verrucomicrobiota bacterium]MDQ6939555.1 DUF2017 domain-containing protein [Verrucomicrobiota bacterium]